MRIIGGSLSGRSIKLPRHVPARPTTIFAKEGLFNVLHHRIDLEGLSVLDLFSGTGSIGVEFLSRGASEVLSIEQNNKMVRVQQQNAEALGIKPTIWKADVFKFIPKCAEKFDIIFADPPYQLNNIDSLPQLIFSNELLKKGGTLIIEHGRANDFSDYEHFEMTKKYGHVTFSFFVI